MKITASTIAMVVTLLGASICVSGQVTVRRENRSMQTIRLHVDGFMKSKSGAT